MKRGERPPVGNAFVWTFAAGAQFALGITDRSPAEFALAFAFFVIGPFAWFVGRP